MRDAFLFTRYIYIYIYIYMQVYFHSIIDFEGRKLRVGPPYFTGRKAELHKSWVPGRRGGKILYGGA